MNKMDKVAEMYIAFRQEIDTYCAQDIVYNLDTRYVYHNNKLVGFLMLHENYVDSFYILPEYRRKGIGKQFIIDEYKKDNCRWNKITIVNNNVIAITFWNSIFNLQLIDMDFCDLHYKILGLRKGK